jgi:hypothetical protein
MSRQSTLTQSKADTVTVLTFAAGIASKPQRAMSAGGQSIEEGLKVDYAAGCGGAEELAFFG